MAEGVACGSFRLSCTPDRPKTDLALAQVKTDYEDSIETWASAPSGYALGYLVNPPSAWPGFSRPLSSL